MTNPIQILFEDSHLIVVNKPAGKLVHPLEVGLVPKVRREATCLSELRDRCGRVLFPVHRLDRATSGVLVFATSRESAVSLCSQFERGDVHKEYRALARGWMQQTVELDYPVWNEIRTQRVAAKTTFSVLEQFERPIPSGKHVTSRYTLVKAIPHTGRYHQIRQHLKHMSHPIIGDTTHGDGVQNRLFRERFNVRRLFLHANRVEFMHPTSGKTLIVESELPLDLMSVLSSWKSAHTVF